MDSKFQYIIHYQIVLYAFFGAAFFFGLAGRDLPNEPLEILPRFVFLSPLPIVVIFIV
jgi:hypothetical protein